jgi:hypothetical protein
MKNILMMGVLLGVFIIAGVVNISCAMPSAEKTPHSDTSSNQSVAYLTGKVAETMDSGGYTYINLEQDGKSTWVAVPITPVTVGQKVSVLPGFVMNDFKSKTLGRTFELIVFSGGLTGEGSKSAGMHGSASSAPAAASPLTNEKIMVKKADGVNAYTVAELHAKRIELDKKSIVLKGQVVKVGMAIMGKNWIHIQDGSGSASDGTNDIIVTSKDAPEVGSVVTASGTLYKDKDFTMGYFYAVIIEDASIK